MSAFGSKADISQAPGFDSSLWVCGYIDQHSAAAELGRGYPGAAGSQISALSNDSTAGTLNVTELS
jgi:hypothetical protein